MQCGVWFSSRMPRHHSAMNTWSKLRKSCSSIMSADSGKYHKSLIFTHISSIQFNPIMASISRPTSACWRCVIRQSIRQPNPAIRWFSNSTHKQPSRARQLAPPRRRISTSPTQKQQVELARESQSYVHQKPAADDKSRVLLQPNNLFHSFSDSPSPIIRKRAAFIKQNAYCSHPDHQQTRQPDSPHDPEARKAGAQPPAHVRYECPDCGIPVSCSEEHFADDYETHLEICDTLREINEDDHDLVSGRFFPEFEYPGPQIDEAQVNMMNWDTFLYSREFNAINDERSLRQATRLVTYPATIASVLHELSPYNMKSDGRLTAEGLKSFSGNKHVTLLNNDIILTTS